MAALDSNRNSVQLHQSKYECNSVVVSATAIALAAITLLVIGILAQQGMILPYFSQSASWSLIGTGIGILAAEFLFLAVQMCKRTNTRSPLSLEGGQGNAALHVQRNPDVLSASVQFGSRVEVTTVRQKGLERFFCCCPGSSNTYEHTDAVVHSSEDGGVGGGRSSMYSSASGGSTSKQPISLSGSALSPSFGSGTSGTTKPSTFTPPPATNPKGDTPKSASNEKKEDAGKTLVAEVTPVTAGNPNELSQQTEDKKEEDPK